MATAEPTLPRGNLALSPELMVPELLKAHPETRAVLDRYGLRGCGGPLGPSESIGFFARVHGVDEAGLLRELNQAIASAQTASTPPADETPDVPGIADTIYRRFFTAGIVLVLTAGATWGAWLLWRIGMGHSFFANPIHRVNAHGMAQISGWVGLFIMGFAYQAFPRIWHTTLASPRLAVWVFTAMLAGILVQVVGMVAYGTWAPALPLALTGGALQVAAVATFAGQILTTYRRSGARFAPYIAFILAALGWFVLAGFANVAHTWVTLTAPDADALVWYVATYQAPLRDLQIHGLALFMILGVSLRMLPALFGVPTVPDRRAWGAFGLLIVAVVGEIALFLAYRWTGHHALAAALLIPWLMLTFGIALVVLPWKPWRPLPERDRVGKFVRAAFGWLAISLAMLLLMPVYHAASGIPFSHAYHGAIRHAITVGFISLMIMGIAAKVVPNLVGADPRTLTSLWGPFVLINLGCFLRVTTQILTDWFDIAYAVVGISGTLEVAALAWWGLGLLALIQQARRAERSGTALERGPGPAPGRLVADHRVADVLAWFPETEPVLVQAGFTALKNPALRRTLARRVTLDQAARIGGVALDPLLDDLNAAIAGRHPALADPRFVPVDQLSQTAPGHAEPPGHSEALRNALP